MPAKGERQTKQKGRGVSGGSKQKHSDKSKRSQRFEGDSSSRVGATCLFGAHVPVSDEGDGLVLSRAGDGENFALFFCTTTKVGENERSVTGIKLLFRIDTDAILGSDYKASFDNWWQLVASMKPAIDGKLDLVARIQSDVGHVGGVDSEQDWFQTVWDRGRCHFVGYLYEPTRVQTKWYDRVRHGEAGCLYYRKCEVR
jgi:hypothetical protein